MMHVYRVVSALALASGGLLVFGSPIPAATEATVKPRITAPGSKDNEELQRLFEEDQADRKSSTIDWTIVQRRDQKRLARIKELYRSDRIQTGADYYHAAMVFQHGATAEDYLLAHELCIVAISKGEMRAKWLAAATEDRFLRTIERPQRFGTQFRSDGDNPFQVEPVDSGVTDELRRAFGVRSLQEAKDFAQNLNDRRGNAEIVKDPALSKELLRRGHLDQETGKALIRFTAEHRLVRPVDISKLDPIVAAQYKTVESRTQEVFRDNLAWLKRVVVERGWPGKSLVGKNAAMSAFLIVQHADSDIDFQEMCLKKMEAGAKGEVEPIQLAYLTDRTLVHRGKKQRFGTQAEWVDGHMVVAPIEDETTVDARRKAIGLPPLSEYLKSLKDVYEHGKGLEPQQVVT
jgi:hypothetical protein